LKKEKERKKAVTKNKKTREGKKNFSFFFLLNKIKRNVSNVEFCARRRVIFLEVFFFFSLEFANFGSILQSIESRWWFIRDNRNYATSVGRAHAIQKCADIDFFSGNIIYFNMSTSFRQNAFCFVSLRNLSNVVLAHPFQERHEGSEALSVLGVAQLVHQALCLLLGELLTQVGQQPEEIFAKHGLV
jgi:hypothetical protein